MTTSYATKRKPNFLKIHAMVLNIIRKCHVMKVLKRNTNLFIDIWGRDLLNLSMKINNYNKIKKQLISAFGTQIQMALIFGVPQDPTGEREEGSVCFYPYFSPNRLWRYVL